MAQIRRFEPRSTNPPDNPQFVSLADLATRWGVQRREIYKQIQTGALRAIKLGPRLVRIRTADAIAFESSPAWSTMQPTVANSGSLPPAPDMAAIAEPAAEPPKA